MWDSRGEQEPLAGRLDHRTFPKPAGETSHSNQTISHNTKKHTKIQIHNCVEKIHD